MRNYSEMFEAYFEEKALIPEGRFCELAYANLEADPVREFRRVYEKLGLPDFSVVEPAVQSYVASLAGYKKNCHVELAANVRTEIGREWKRTFEMEISSPSFALHRSREIGLSMYAGVAGRNGVRLTAGTQPDKGYLGLQFTTVHQTPDDACGPGSHSSVGHGAMPPKSWGSGGKAPSRR